MNASKLTPAEAGYSMPAEWAPHEATWLGWPHNVTDWPGKMEAVQWVYAEIVRQLVKGEKVRILLNADEDKKRVLKILEQAGADVEKVEFFILPTDRGWMRDSGPLFVTKSGEGKKAVVDFHFNGWARYSDWHKDRQVPRFVADQFGLEWFDARRGEKELVLEGGSVDINGRGTLITTEECLLDQRTQARNPGLDKADTESMLRDYLGVEQILWLGKGIAGDDTHGHVDDLCRFVSPDTVVLCFEKNTADPNYEVLEENRERVQGMRLENGEKLNVVDLPMPAPLYFDGERLPASYANFYISNAAVLVPTFNDPNDRVALGILAELITDRPVVGIHAVDLVLGLGTLHCLTQQEPLNEEKE